MPGVAQGDRIRSQDVTAIMRRINAIEDFTFERQTRGSVLGLAVDSSNHIHVQVGLVNVYTSVGKLINVWSPAGFLRGWNGTYLYALGGGSSTTVSRYTSGGVLVGTFEYNEDNALFEPGRDGFVYGANEEDFEGVTAWVLYRYNAAGSFQAKALIASSVFIANGLSAITTDGSGNVYCITVDPPRVYKLDSDLNADDDWSLGSATSVDDDSAAATTSEKTIITDALDEEINVYGATGSLDDSWVNAPDVSAAYLDRDSSNLLYVNRADEAGAEIAVYNLSGTLQRSWDVYGYIAYTNGQTPFFKYPTTSLGDKVSLGTPDGGASIPALTAFEPDETYPGGILPRNEIGDMHNAIEAVLVYYVNAGTGNAFNWTGGSADNLYQVAVGGVGAYDWRATADGSLIRETYIDEMHLCLSVLESSNLV